MARKFLTAIDLTKNELQNAVIQNLATAPSTPAAGQIYFNTNDDTLYFYDGSAWVDFVQQSTVAYDTFSNRPVAAAGNAGTLFYATDYHLLYLSNGTAWSQISQFGNVSAQTAYGDTSSNGTSNDYARADHVHGTPSLSTATPQSLSIGNSPSAGSGTLPSKDDHVHQMPAFGNVTSQTSFGASSSNGTSADVAHADHTHGTPTHDNAAHSGINISALAAPTANVSWGGYKITSLSDPSADSDAATKGYVDSVAQGLDIKASVRLVTAAALASYSYASTGGGTLTASANAALSIDGVAVDNNDRILVKNETSTNAPYNGIYVVTDKGSGSTPWVLTRSGDANTSGEVTSGMFVFATAGSTLANTSWVLTTPDPIVLNTTNLTFSQFSGAGTYTASNGVQLVGNDFSGVAASGGGLSVSSSGFAVDTSVVVRKYAASIGDNSNTSLTVTHNLGTKDVTVAVYDNSSPYAEVMCDVQHTNTTTITLLFSVAPTTNQYRVVVHG